MSLGKPGVHALDKKLKAAATIGFRGVELFWDDLEAYAGVSTCTAPSETRTMHLIRAAQLIRQICDSYRLKVVSLQPFRNYDGVADEELRAQHIVEFKTWLSVAQVLGADFIAVPSTIEADNRTHSADPDIIAGTLAELARMARPYHIGILYENLCFAAHVQSWPEAWDAIVRTNAPNIGFLPDTFNLCGDTFADPSVPSGMTPNGAQELEDSLGELVKTVPRRRMPLLQVADAEHMHTPLTPQHPWMAGCLNAKMAWSRNARLFPLEKGGYLPIMSVVKALVDSGWSGWLSMEVFSRTTAVEGHKTILEHAERAWNSWERLADAMGWESRPPPVQQWEERH